LGTKFNVLDLAAAGNKSATWPPPPPPRCGGEWKETGRKLVGRDKGILTEQQTKGTVTTMIYIRRKHDTNRTTHRAVLPDRTGIHAPKPQVSSRHAAPSPHQNPAWWHMVWNTRLCLARLGLGQPTRLCPFWDSV